MATLCDTQLIRLAQTNELVTPFDAELVNPASIDLRVGATARVEINYWNAPDSSASPDDKLWGDRFPLEDGFLLAKGHNILLDTFEYVCIPNDCMAEMWLKSSAGRNGGDMYKAGYIDPGFHGTLTFRYRNDMRRPILIKPGVRLVQMVVREMSQTPRQLYPERGHYAGQTGPTEAWS